MGISEDIYDYVESSPVVEEKTVETPEEDVTSSKERMDSTDDLVIAPSGSSDATNRRVALGSMPFQYLRRCWNIWRRPTLCPGYRRLEWICVRLGLSFRHAHLLV